MEAQPSLVRAQRRVELHTVSSVHLQLALIVLPHDPELHHALWDRRHGERLAVLGVLLEQRAVLECAGELY
jgi:hypothetical protein